MKRGYPAPFSEQDIFDYIQANPGCSSASIAEFYDVHVDTVTKRVTALHRAGAINRKKLGTGGNMLTAVGWIDRKEGRITPRQLITNPWAMGFLA